MPEQRSLIIFQIFIVHFGKSIYFDLSQKPSSLCKCDIKLLVDDRDCRVNSIFCDFLMRVSAAEIYHPRHLPCLQTFSFSLTAWISSSVANASPNYKCVHRVPWWTGWMSVKANRTDPRRGFISSVWWRGNAKGLQASSRDSETTFPSGRPVKVWCASVMKLSALLCLLFGLLCLWWLHHSPRKAVARSLADIWGRDM